MAAKISNTNTVSIHRAKIITTVVHIILILLAILPLLALKPVAPTLTKEEPIQNQELKSEIGCQPIAFAICISSNSLGGRQKA